jgi:hypothetical protein
MMQLHNVGSGPQGQDELGELSRTGKADQTLKERDGQVIGFNELTWCQPITNIISR